MSERYVVVGSNSFSGSHMVRQLLEHGETVLATSRSAEPADVFLPYRWGTDLSRLEFRQLDLNRDAAEIMRAVRNFNPDYVINFAAQGMVAQSWDRPADWYRTNVVGQVEFIEGVRRLPSLAKYVHITTPEVYGSTDGWTSEHTNFAPSTPYAVSRAALDLHLLAVHHAYDFPVVMTRAANVYGPGQQIYRIIPRALLSARIGRRLPLHGGGHSVRSFIHISDVAAATYLVARKGVSGQTYHISTNETVTIRDLIERVARLTEVSFDQLAEVVGERLGKDSAYLLDSTRARTELGWEPQVDLASGLDDTLAWVDENRDFLSTVPAEYIHKP